jgi:hypothetical protein
MMKIILPFIAILLVAQMALSMTDQDALLKAQAIWGQEAYIHKVKRFSWWSWKYRVTYQVGCRWALTGSTIIAGQATGSWENAFSVVNMKINGPHTLSAVARDTIGQTTESAPVLIYACNQ